MQNKDIKALLHDLEESAAVRLAEDFPPLTDAEQERMFQEISRRMAEEKPDMVQETVPVISSRPSRWRQYLSAAACVLLVCGTFAGIGMLGGLRTEPSEETSPTEAQFHEGERAHAVGERYTAGNFTSSGKLWLTVEKCGMLEGTEYYFVTLTLESENAVSLSPEQPDVFLADNFLLSYRLPGGDWQTIQPCIITGNSPADGYPNAILLRSGESQTIELCYPMEERPVECRLVMGYSGENNYTVLETDTEYLQPENEYDADVIYNAPAEEE